MTFKGVIFDLDGTLIDSLQDIAQAANHALKSHQLSTHSKEAYRYFVGDGMNALITRILPPERRTDADLLTKILHATRSRLAQAWHVETMPYDGIDPMLQDLSRTTLKRAVLSNKPHPMTQQAVEYFFPSAGLTPVMGVCDQVPPKPDTTGAKMIQKQWGFEPAEIVFVGDTKTDMTLASNAGFFSVGVTWGFRPRQELEAYGAQKIIEHPKQLLSLF